MTHYWSTDGTYQIKAQTRDEYGSTSGWSTSFTVYVQTGTSEEQLDQEQTDYSYDYRLYSSKWAAQSFEPSEDFLNRVELYMNRYGSPTDDLVLSIRSSLTGPDLTVCSKPASQIPTGISWVNFDFDDISVTPGNTYYIVLRTAGGNNFKSYEWGFGSYTPYTQGTFWKSSTSGSSWTEYTSYDFCFKTYGNSEINSPPNIPSNPSGPNSLMIGTSATYSSSTTDPDGDQIKYRFYWGDGTFSTWTSLVNSGPVSYTHLRAHET